MPWNLFTRCKNSVLAKSCVKPAGDGVNRLQLIELEQRVLFDGAPLEALLNDLQNSSELTIGPSHTTPDSYVPTFDFLGFVEPSQESFFQPAPIGAAGTIELVIIDGSVANYQELLNDLSLGSKSGVAFSVLFLDNGLDGIDQITGFLNNHHNVDAIHIVSHGMAGQLQLGNRWFDESDLGSYATQLGQWRSSLNPDADLLFYGCDLASNLAGQKLIATISELTGADVAASTDSTGHALFNANWSLEYSVGSIESDVVFSSAVQHDWIGKLATITVTTTNDDVDGDTSSVANLLASRGADGFISLREAILAVNADAGGDTIVLGAGTYSLTRTGSGENSALTGDLDILKSMTIVGESPSTTMINAAGIDRVFHVLSGTVDISYLTVQGGNANAGSPENGGGLLVASSAYVTINNATFIGNSGRDGGAISSSGALTLTNVTVDGNTATMTGGGITTTGTTTLFGVTVSNNKTSGIRGGGIAVGAGSFSATNVTISGNSSGSDGGGISTLRAITLQNATITNNTADYGSGIYTQGAGSASLRNSIVAGNNTSADVYGSFTSQGNNLIGNKGATTGFTHGTNGDQVGTSGSPLNAILGTLQNNGGPTLTHALLAGSSAINSGQSTGAPATDQRGFARVGTLDIGAFEFGANSSLFNRDEFLVNDTISSQQHTSAEDRGSQQAVSLAADGSYVVIWTSTGQDGSGEGIYGQRFNSAGIAITPELPIHVSTGNDQQWARVASADDGSFVVTWTSNHGLNAEDVYVRRFAANGVALTGEILVNTTTAGTQKNSVIGMNSATGEFVIAWQGNGTQAGELDNAGIFGQRFSSNGTAIGGEFRVNANTASTQYDAAISVNSNGEFVVVWDDPAGFHFQRFNNSGAEFGGQVTVDSSITAGNGTVAMHSDGSLVAVWRSTGGAQDIFIRQYTAAGTSVAVAAIVNTTTGGVQSEPSITMDSTGSFIIVWEGNGPGDNSGIFGQKYNSAGARDGSEFLINTTTTGTQHKASAAMLDSNNFVVVWSGNGNQPGQVDTSGVFARQFGNAVTNSPPTDIGPNSFSINENTDTSGGYSLGILTATDADSGETLTYTIRPGGDAGKFSIGGTGLNELVLTDGLLDFESTSSYSVNIRVIDSVGNSYDETLIVNVNDLNEAPTIAAQTFNINENSSNGSVVGTVTASDVDSGSNGVLIYAITGGTGAGVFAINATTGQISVANASLLNFETTPSFTLSIRTSDGGTPGLNATATITIKLLDVNEAPVISAQTFNVNENSANGTVIGTVLASDVDAGANGILSYAITGGSGVGVFAINANTGQITVANASLLDFEAMPSFTMTVRASDGGTPGLNTTATITINLLDTNETPVIATQTFSVNENSANSTVIGSVLASDVDASANGTLSYAITSGTGVGVFAINSSTGQITVANGSLLNFEVTPTFTLTVRASDGGAPGLNSSATITINLQDLNESPFAIAPTGFSINENINTTGGLSVGTLAASDPDSGETLTYSIRPGGDAVKFSIGGAALNELILSDGLLNFESKSAYSVMVRVTDSAGNTFNQLMTVSVNNLNEAPGLCLVNVVSSIPENTSTTAGIKVADILITDDLPGANTLSLTGIDASKFMIVGGNELYLKAGTILDYESRSSLTVTISVDDSSVGFTPDDTTTLTILISDVNEAPVAINESYTVLFNSALIAAPGFLVNDSDPDGDVLSFVVITFPANGLLTVNPDGSFTYIPNSGFSGTDFFVYQVTDGVNFPSQATAQIAVTPFGVLPPIKNPVTPSDSAPAVVDSGTQPDPQSDDKIELKPVGNPLKNSQTPEPVDSTPADGNESLDQNDFVVDVSLHESNSTGQGPDLSSLFAFANASNSRQSSELASNSEFVQLTYSLSSLAITTLDALRDELTNENTMTRALVGSTVFAATTLSVGYVVWLIRGGVLLSSVLSSMPAWRMVDPLPVLGYLDDEEDRTDDDSLESLVTKSNESRANQESLNTVQA